MALAVDTEKQKQKQKPPSTAAYSIGQFCIDHDISFSTYSKLREQGLGPKEMRLGGRCIRISAEDAAEWRKARANPKGTVQVGRHLARAEYDGAGDDAKVIRASLEVC